RRAARANGAWWDSGGTRASLAGTPVGIPTSILPPKGPCSQFLDEQVTELHPPAVFLKADVPLVAQDAGVGLGVLGLVVVEVGIDDLLAVELDGDLPALAGDLVAVPLAYRFGGELGRRDHTVDRAGVLPLLEVLVRGVVEDLDLHPRVSRVALHRR